MNAPRWRLPSGQNAGAEDAPAWSSSPLRVFLADALLSVLFLYISGYFALGRVLPPRATAIMGGILAVGSLLTAVVFRLVRTARWRWLALPLGSLLPVLVFALARPSFAGLASTKLFNQLTGGLLILRLALYSARSWYPPLARWVVASEKSGRWSFVRLLADLLLTVITGLVVGGYALEKNYPLTDLLAMAACAAAGQAMAMAYSDRVGARHWLRFAKPALGTIMALGAWALVGPKGDASPYWGDVAVVYAGLLPLQFVWHAWHRRKASAAGTGLLAPLQWAIVTTVVLLIHRTLLGNGTIGAGDAYWYRIMTADFVTQWRAGVFPVFAGQSEFAFNGAVSPVRLAPGLQHFAGLLDLVTFHQMTFSGLLNLVLALSYLGGALTCHGCLRAIEPRTPWLAVALSLLFANCPGMLGLAYAGDLFMSVTTLTFIPLALYGSWRTLQQRDRTGMIILAASLAAMWYCHPPIAFWVTVMATVTQLVRLPGEFRESKAWRNWATGAFCFGILALFCFVSVETLRLAGNATNRLVLLENIRNAFVASLQPVVQLNMASLGTYQLGWSLWGCLATGLVGLAWTSSRRPLAALLLATFVVVVFAVPVPWLTEKLWLAVPQAVADITYMWPMQRFYALLAAPVVFVAYLVLAPLLVRWPRSAVGLMPLLLAGLTWSALEGKKFSTHIALSSGTPEQAALQLLPQNVFLTRYAFNPFPTPPPYFSHGFIDPMMELRLLFTDAQREFDSNRAGLERAPDKVVSSGVLTTNRDNPASPVVDLVPRFSLQPKRRYALKFEFEHPDFAGAFRVIGTRLNRLYWMPNSGFGTALTGPSRAFGTGAGQSHTITLWTDGATAEEVRLQFVFSGEVPREIPTFARFELVEYDSSRLPIQVESWTPFRARVRSGGDTWLETPRLYLPGYQATVNGKRVKATASPEGLVKIPIPAGESRVELWYAGPLPLRLAYYTSLVAWLALLVFAARALWVGRNQQATAGRY